jgi:sortase B
MKKILLLPLIVAIVLSVVAIFSSCSTIIVPEKPAETQPVEQIVIKPDETIETVEPIESADVTTLKKWQSVNSHVTGTISIQGLSEEPVLTVPSFDDQNYYIHKDINGNSSKKGSLFTAYDAVFGESNVTCIFGHTMRDGSMFGQLSRFLDKNYLLENPTFEIGTEAGTKTVKIIAVGHVDSDYIRGGWYYPQPQLNENEFSVFKTQVENHAELIIDDELDYASKYVILSCCSYGYEGERLFVLGKIL